MRSRRDNMIFQSIARLSPGVAIDGGRARVQAIAARVAHGSPEARKAWSSDLIPLRDYVVERELRDALLVLLAAVGVVLLIVCVNIANLLLARGTGARARDRRTDGARRQPGAARAPALRRVCCSPRCGGAIGVGLRGRL